MKIQLGFALLLGLSGAALATDDGTALLKQGEQLAVASDCQACHTQPGGGKPFAGGYGINSPMGVILLHQYHPFGA